MGPTAHAKGWSGSRRERLIYSSPTGGGPSLRDSGRFFDARQRVSHPRRAARQSHRERRIASIIVTALAAPKIPRNKRSPRANARPHPKAASAASASSSRKLGSVQGSFI